MRKAANQVLLFEPEPPPVVAAPVNPKKAITPEAEWMQKNQRKNPRQLFAELTEVRQNAAMKQLANWIGACVRAQFTRYFIEQEKITVWREILITLLQQQELGKLPADKINWNVAPVTSEPFRRYDQYISPKDLKI
jgi:hypothetical protein